VAEHSDLRAESERLDALLRDIESHGDPAARQRVLDVVGLLMTLHRAAFDRMLALAANPASGGPALVNQLADDTIVGPMLLVHDLHPHSLDVRLARTAERVRPIIAARGCRLEIGRLDLPAVHVAVTGLPALAADGAAGLRALIERAVLDCAPEVSSVVFDAVPADVSASACGDHSRGALIQITRPEDYDAASTGSPR
jgi:hypothetical protein